jgi:hypothetical protein
MGDIVAGILHYRDHFSQDKTICPEKINERDGQYEYETTGESAGKKKDLSSIDQFSLIFELISFDKIKNKKDGGYHRIIDTIFKERITGGSKETKLAAEQYKGGNIPAYDEHRYRRTNDGRTQ